MQLIHTKHPSPQETTVSEYDKQNLFRVFMHALTRTKSRLFQFLYSWSLLKDDASFTSLFFRPMVAYYFAILITFVNTSNKNVQKLANNFATDVQTEDADAYYPKKTFICGLQYFEKESHRLYNNKESEFPSLIDFLLFGQFQCLHTGLSNECIPLIQKHFPASKQWVTSMNQLLESRRYNRLYTAGKVMESSYLERIVFWIGFVLGFPLNATAASVALATRSKL